MVYIFFVDQNDNLFVLFDFQIFFNNYVINKFNSFFIGVIGCILVYDFDVLDSFNYIFVQGNELCLLLLDFVMGELQFSCDLDNNWLLEVFMEVFVFDGIYSVMVFCILCVIIIMDDMLINSIIVCLENMFQEKFLFLLLVFFVEGVVVVLFIIKDDVFVFNVQNDIDVSFNILNVIFLVLLFGGVCGQFFLLEDLQEQIYLNWMLLIIIFMQCVLFFDDNICLCEFCENYMKCVFVL